MIKLRPHHLLCIHSFQGKGYNGAFVDNMAAIVDKIKNNPEIIIEVCETTDDICQKCPSIQADDVCEFGDKVKKLDDSVLQPFNVPVGVASYNTLRAILQKETTLPTLMATCAGCEWRDHMNCPSTIIATLKKHN